MSHFAAVLDANVLYSYPLTSVLLLLCVSCCCRLIAWLCLVNESAVFHPRGQGLGRDA
jgi:hypothetical protein